MRQSHVPPVYIHYIIRLFAKLPHHIPDDLFELTSVKLTRAQATQINIFILKTESLIDPQRNWNGGSDTWLQQGSKSGSTDSLQLFTYDDIMLWKT